MDKNPNRMSSLGAGLLRLWTELQIAENRSITAAELARRASTSEQAVLGRTPWSIILGRNYHSAGETGQLFSTLGVTVEDLERIGEGDYARLKAVLNER